MPVWANDAPSGDKIAADASASDRNKARKRAKLISAAPNMLAQLKAARRLIFRCGEMLNEPFFAELSEIDAAIAKAEA